MQKYEPSDRKDRFSRSFFACTFCVPSAKPNPFTNLRRPSAAIVRRTHFWDGPQRVSPRKTTLLFCPLRHVLAKLRASHRQAINSQVIGVWENSRKTCKIARFPSRLLAALVACSRTLCCVLWCSMLSWLSRVSFSLHVLILLDFWSYYLSNIPSAGAPPSWMFVRSCSQLRFVQLLCGSHDCGFHDFAFYFSSHASGWRRVFCIPLARHTKCFHGLLPHVLSHGHVPKTPSPKALTCYLDLQSEMQLA